MNRTLVRGINPTFIVGGFDVADVVNKYIEGFYNDVSIDDIRPKSNTIRKVSEAITDNQNASKFVVIDNRGIRTTIVSSNIMKTNKCQWCRDNLQETCLGIPIRHVPSGDMKFETEGCYCSFECAYSDLIKSHLNNPMYRNSESYLNYAFKISYPDKHLKPAPDWKLHECNGGSLTSDRFHDGQHRYYDTGRLKCISMSRNYIVR